MIKDRMQEFKAASLNNLAGEEGEGGDEPHCIIMMTNSNLSLENFQKEIDDILSSLNSVTAMVEEMDRIHSFILSSPTNDEKTKQKLDDIMSEVKRIATRVRGRLRTIEEDVSKVDPEKSTAEFRIKKTQLQMLEHKVVSVMTEYNRAQLEYREKCKDRIKRQLEIREVSKTDEEIEEILETGTSRIFTEGIHMDTNQMRQCVQEIEARHEDIKNLEKSIKELYDLFVDMANLVEAQGATIDRIENHVHNALNYVQVGAEQTKKAMEFQGSSRKKKIILLAILLLILLAIILYFVISQSK